MNKETFLEYLKELNITPTNKMLEQLDKYYKILVEKNKYINLTAITKEEDVYLKHFYDSLTISKVINLEEPLSLADLGTGAGFPGIVLKIIYPNLKITLVDSLEKRCKFLEELIKELELTNINVICSRIETFSVNNKEKYDVLVTRAVAKTKVMLEIGVQALKINGNFILMKSNVTEELQNIENTIKLLDLDFTKQEEFDLPIENSKRNILMFTKKMSTNNKYPRDFAKIKKSTL